MKFITTARGLEDCIAALDNGKPLAMDTEFMRTRTYYAQLALLQFTTGDDVFLVDPLAIDDLQPLWDFLAGPQTKVLHACGEDLEVLPCDMAPLFDTQVAATFTGLGMSLGYAGLVKHFFDVELDKGQSRTDWMKRPLSEAQLRYCVNDVIYLPNAQQRLSEALERLGRTAWFEDECNRQLRLRGREPALDKAYLEVKNAWLLSRRELGVLKVLAAWRLDSAKRRDMAVGHVLKDDQLWALAKDQPQSRSALKQLELPPVVLRKFGDELLEMVGRGLALDEEQLPGRIERIIDLPKYKERLAELKAQVARAAAETDLPEAFIGSKKLLHEVLHYRHRLNDQEREQAAKPVLMTGWRQELVTLDV
ncbi:ribonuclease D [Gallaecimonas sp. GXIMD4217]|uniref:ribonuclease D n=1 Tax=Gallaecimonas sp. GXIMD4217 TaxID=3131927 RepID=UPI00311B2E59